MHFKVVLIFLQKGNLVADFIYVYVLKRVKILMLNQSYRKIFTFKEVLLIKTAHDQHGS
jgi:hypothetical protein